MIILAGVIPCSGMAAYFENISIEQGLSQSTVNDIVQDKYGFIWIATTDGLNRYDGIEILHFKSTGSSDSSLSISNSSLFNITVDEDGNLWISTKKGLNFFNTTNYETKHFLHDPENSNSITLDDARSTAFDSKGFLWISSKNGLDRLDPRTENFKYFPFKYDNAKYQCSVIVRKVFVDASDNIWIASNNGLCRFDSESYKSEFINYRNNLHESASVVVYDIIQENENEFWVATDNGLFKYNVNLKESVSYYHDPNNLNSIVHNSITKVTKSGSDLLWVATEEGLSLLNNKNQSFLSFKHHENQKHSLSSNNLQTVFIDNSGLVWVGSNGSGLDIYNPRQLLFKHINHKSESESHALSNPSVWSFANAYGYLWVSTGKGLNRLDMKTGKIKYYYSNTNHKNSLVNNVVYDVFPGNERDLWVSTKNGLSRLYVDDEIFENYIHDVNDPDSIPHNYIISLYYDGDSNLVWMSAYQQGIMIFNPRTKKFTTLKHNPNDSNSLNHDYVVKIEKIEKNFMMFSTPNGLNRYNPTTKLFEHLPNDSYKIGIGSNDIKKSKSGNILIASDDGLVVLDSATFQMVEIYNIEDGLDDDKIYSIEEDSQGNIWVGTNHGLSRINPETHDIRNFDVSDGLQGFEFNSSASFNDGQYLYFGGFNGFNYFDPDEINTNNFSPPVVVTEFSVHAKPIYNYLIKDFINLSYEDSFFAFEFAALDFTSPKKNQYAFMLEGFDENWINNKNRNFASYTNLDGGKYTFRVKAANKYGIWNEHGAAIAIMISPPYWKTMWFRLAAILIILIIIFTVYLLRVRSIKARNKILEKQVNARTEDLQNTLIELGETKDALIEAAHKAGMADTATGVLHNVGNLLNSVVTSAGVIREVIGDSVSRKLFKVHKVLNDNKDNINEYLYKDPQGRKLPLFIMALIESLGKENGKLIENTVRLKEKIDSIKETVLAQQRFAQGSGFVEELSLSDIIEDSILLQSGSIERHEIKIEKNFDESLPKIRVQKAKLVQILINLSLLSR